MTYPLPERLAEEHFGDFSVYDMIGAEGARRRCIAALREAVEECAALIEDGWPDQADRIRALLEPSE